MKTNKFTIVAMFLLIIALCFPTELFARSSRKKAGPKYAAEMALTNLKEGLYEQYASSYYKLSKKDKGRLLKDVKSDIKPKKGIRKFRINKVRVSDRGNFAEVTYTLYFKNRTRKRYESTVWRLVDNVWYCTYKQSLVGGYW